MSRPSHPVAARGADPRGGRRSPERGIQHLRSAHQCRNHLASLLAHWDRHDWQSLFIEQRRAWMDGRIRLAVFGHALFEHALNPDMLLVSKTLVVLGKADEAAIAHVLLSAKGLADPQQLRPLPLAGIPGWDARKQDAAFIRDQPCFRPPRPGRRYPPALLSNL